MGSYTKEYFMYLRSLLDKPVKLTIWDHYEATTGLLWTKTVETDVDELWLLYNAKFQANKQAGGNWTTLVCTIINKSSVSVSNYITLIYEPTPTGNTIGPHYVFPTGTARTDVVTQAPQIVLPESKVNFLVTVSGTALTSVQAQLIYVKASTHLLETLPKVEEERGWWKHFERT